MQEIIILADAEYKRHSRVQLSTRGHVEHRPSFKERKGRKSSKSKENDVNLPGQSSMCVELPLGNGRWTREGVSKAEPQLM